VSYRRNTFLKALKNRKYIYGYKYQVPSRYNKLIDSIYAVTRHWFFKFIAVLRNKEPYFRWHNQLIDNAGHKKIMRICLRLWKNVTKNKLPSNTFNRNVSWNIANTRMITKCKRIKCLFEILICVKFYLTPFTRGWPLFLPGCRLVWKGNYDISFMNKVTLYSIDYF
jgi:hypothetical protein